MKINIMLREARAKKGITQAKIQKVLGYKSSQFVSNFEHGTSLPPAEKLSKLAKAIDIPFNVLKRAYIETATERLLAKIK